VRSAAAGERTSTAITGLARAREAILRFVPHALVLTVVVQQHRGHVGAYGMVGLFLLAAPLAEWMLGRERVGASVAGATGVAKRVAPWLWVPLHLVLFGVGVASMQRADAVWQAIGPGFATGVLCGMFGMAAAHELLHRGRCARRVAWLLLALSADAHFAEEHIHGHHLRVGTRDDSASARLGEGVYAFLWRGVPGAWRSAWRIEFAPRLAEHRVRIVAGTAVFVALAAAAGALAGATGVMFVIVQAAVAAGTLEVTNYLQHYGLSRTDANEPIAAHHIWDCRYRLTNLLLFDLGYHTQHHLGTRPTADAPGLPAGYFTMFSLALLPPLWRKVMDPRVAWVMRRAFQAADKGRSR
jgi:alkane 1-monooxygenase